MLTFEQTRSLKPGDTIYSHVGWKDGQVCSTVAWQVDKIHPRSIDITCPTFVRNRHMRWVYSEFPLTYWSVENPVAQPAKPKSKYEMPTQIKGMRKLSEECYADPYFLWGDNFVASASDDPSHPQGVWSYDVVEDWDLVQTNIGIAVLTWDELPETLQRFLCNFFAADKPMGYQITISVYAVDEMCNLITNLGTHFVTTGMKDEADATVVAKQLAGIAGRYVEKNVPDDLIIQLEG